MNTQIATELGWVGEQPLAVEVLAADLPDHPGTLQLVELLLKEPTHVDQLTRDDNRQTELVPRFLAIALASFSIYSLALALIFNLMGQASLPQLLRQHWSGGVASIFSLWTAYTVGTVAACGVCLPSFYFFGLLAGVRISVMQVTGHVMKGLAATSMMLLGILPIYLAAVLGLTVFNAQTETLEAAVWTGLALPCWAGLWGGLSILNGFMGLADTLPAHCRDRRACFLRRLTFFWAVCYLTVTPVMIWTLWKFCAERLA